MQISLQITQGLLPLLLQIFEIREYISPFLAGFGDNIPQLQVSLDGLNGLVAI